MTGARPRYVRRSRATPRATVADQRAVAALRRSAARHRTRTDDRGSTSARTRVPGEAAALAAVRTP